MNQAPKKHGIGLQIIKPGSFLFAFWFPSLEVKFTSCFLGKQEDERIFLLFYFIFFPSPQMKTELLLQTTEQTAWAPTTSPASRASFQERELAGLRAAGSGCSPFFFPGSLQPGPVGQEEGEGWQRPGGGAGNLGDVERHSPAR